MTIASTEPVGQHAAISRAHEKGAHQIHGGEIQEEKYRPLNQKNLRSPQAAFYAPMG